MTRSSSATTTLLALLLVLIQLVLILVLELVLILILLRFHNNRITNNTDARPYAYKYKKMIGKKAVVVTLSAEYCVIVFDDHETDSRYMPYYKNLTRV